MTAPPFARRRLAPVLAALVAVCLFVVPAAHATPPSGVVPPKAYYLALGDSLAYGYQQAKFNTEIQSTGTLDPTSFNTGYVDDFAAQMAPLSPGLQVVNDGCPGETSDSMINGNRPGFCSTGAGFPSVWLHHPYTGSQLDDAVAFLKAHPKQTSPITIDIGANDLRAVEFACSFDPTCIAGAAPGAFGHIAANLGTILTALRGAAPNAEIIVMGLYNPGFTLPGSDALVEGAFNPTMQSVASQFGAFFADPFPAINHGSGFPSEAASVCSQIAICTPLQDIHPFDNGYAAIAAVIWQASQYATLH